MTADPTTGPLRFAYWVPNVSGGLVTSTIDQRTGWSFDCNRTLARLAERVTMSATSCSTTSCRRTMGSSDHDDH